jgi:hypothetical protein
MWLENLAERIQAAHRAAERADQIASVAIRVFIKRRIEVGEALSQARELLPPAEFLIWLEGLGIGQAEAGNALAEHWTRLIEQGQQNLNPPVLAVRGRTRRTSPLLTRSFEH